MIPGPTPVVRSIQDEMGREIQAFGDPRFVRDFGQLIGDLGTMFDCSGQTFVVAGTGTLAMEMAIANTTRRGDSVLIVSHGYFGDRFIDVCERKGLHVDVLQAEWGTIVPVEKIEAALRSKKYAAMTVTHVDTATGVCAPAEEIGRMMKNFPDTVYILDGVCATGAHLEQVDAMNIDILFTGTQKAFGVCPGLLMLWAGKKALARRKTLGVIPEYYVDFDRWIPVMNDTSKYFATPAINLIWALAEAVRIIKAEGLTARYERHLKNGRAMQAAIEALGFSILAEPAHRAVTLSNVLYPAGVDDAQFRSFLYEEGVVVGGGLAAYAGKMFRIGHMGNVDENDMTAVLGAIERTLHRMGKLSRMGAGVGAYLDAMAK